MRVEYLRARLSEYLKYGLLTDGTVNPNTLNALERFVLKLEPVIQSDIPLPVKNKPSRKSLLQSMEPGDSVLFVGATRQQVFDWYYTPARRLGIEIETAIEEDGVRMWRKT